MNQLILSKYHLSEKDLLGSGGESWVYRLDERRVLRIAKGGVTKRLYLEKSKVFYDSLPKLDFALPIIYLIEEVGGSITSIENKISGEPLSRVLPRLSGEEKQKVFSNYLTAVETLKGITYTALPYGELLTVQPITASSWSTFLSTVIIEKTAKNDLLGAVPRLEEITQLTLGMIAN